MRHKVTSTTVFLVTAILVTAFTGSRYVYQRSFWYRLQKTKGDMKEAISSETRYSTHKEAATLKVIENMTWSGTRLPVLTYAGVTSVTLYGAPVIHLEVWWIQGRRQVEQLELSDGSTIVWNALIGPGEADTLKDRLLCRYIRDFEPKGAPLALRNQSLYSTASHLDVIAVAEGGEVAGTTRLRAFDNQ